MGPAAPLASLARPGQAMATVMSRALERLFGHVIMGSNGFQGLHRKPVVVGAGDLDKAGEQ
jgi:hypothetical protein